MSEVLAILLLIAVLGLLLLARHLRVTLRERDHAWDAGAQQAQLNLKGNAELKAVQAALEMSQREAEELRASLCELERHDRHTRLLRHHQLAIVHRFSRQQLHYMEPLQASALVEYTANDLRRKIGIQAALHAVLVREEDPQTKDLTLRLSLTVAEPHS